MDGDTTSKGCDYDRNIAQYNVNFDTGMGQILKSITTLNEETKYWRFVR